MSLKRLSLLTAVGGATALFLAVTISQYLDWRYQMRERALSDQEDRNHIGADRPPGPETFYPLEAVERQPVTQFQIVDVASSVDFVDDKENVMGIEINGAARAYPINMMAGPAREIFNDHVGGRAIAATW